MAKQVKEFNLVQGDKVIAVSVKTTTKKFFDNLINDYRKIGALNSGEVKIVPVVPLFS